MWALGARWYKCCTQIYADYFRVAVPCKELSELFGVRTHLSIHVDIQESWADGRAKAGMQGTVHITGSADVAVADTHAVVDHPVVRRSTAMPLPMFVQTMSI